MGNLFAKLWAKLAGDRELKILMLGLDGAGKTTAFYQFKFGEPVCTVPTIGFNFECVEYKNLKFAVWDVGGQQMLRAIWQYYFDNTHALIFMIDSADLDRVALAREELTKLLEDETLKSAVLLVFANKRDLPNALSVPELAETLGLNPLTPRRWFIQSTVATTGEGLYEGLDWLAWALNQRT